MTLYKPKYETMSLQYIEDLIASMKLMIDASQQYETHLTEVADSPDTMKELYTLQDDIDRALIRYNGALDFLKARVG